MGLDYSSQLAVGFVFQMEEVLDHFRKVTPEVSHMEDRYDEKTGKKVKPVKVVDEAEDEAWAWPGEEEVYEAWDFIDEVLGSKFRCNPLIFGDVSGGDTFVCFAVSVKEDNKSGIEDVDCGRVSFAGNLSYESVVDAGRELRYLKKRLEDADLKPKNPVVQNCWTIA